MESGYRLSETEAIILRSEYDLSERKIGKNTADQVREKLNVSEVYASIERKIRQSMDILFTFSRHFEQMDDKHYSHAKAIKEEIIQAATFQHIFSGIFNSPSIPAKSRLLIAKMMFEVGGAQLIQSWEYDPVYRKLVIEPIKQLAQNIEDLSRSPSYSGSNPDLTEIAGKMPANIRKKIADGPHST